MPWQYTVGSFAKVLHVPVRRNATFLFMHAGIRTLTFSPCGDFALAVLSVALLAQDLDLDLPHRRVHLVILR